MADVTLTFAAKDAGFAAAMQRMQGSLAAFNSSMGGMTQMSAKVRGSFGSFTNSVLGLGAAYLGVSQAISAFNKALDFSGQMADLSEITGESAGNLAVLERAFANTDIGGEKMLPMLSKMTEFVQQLSKGQGEAVATANMIGISLNNLKGKAPIQQFETLLKAIARLPDETARLTASGDVFGNRMGGKLIPLANNFNGELEKARTQLGSLVGILDKNAQSLDELGDTLKNSVGNKLTELTIGFLAGVKGANDLADAMSRIDAAGAGIDLGRMFSGAMQEPGQAFVAVGERLLEYVLRAGNALINATAFAGEVYKRALLDPEVFTRMKNGFMAVMGAWANWFNRLLASTIKTVLLEPLSQLPAILGGSAFKTMLTGLEKMQQQLDADAASFGAALTDSLAGGAERTLEIAKQMNAGRQDVDVLGAGRQKQEADAAFDRVRQLGMPPASPFANEPKAMQDIRAELEKVMQQPDSPEKKGRENELINALKDLRASLQPSAIYAPPPVQQARDAAMSQPARDEAVNAESGKSNALDEVASETTLQKVAKFLEELNGKLPQPVLV